MAVSERIDAPYEALSKDVGLIDRSERGKLALTGAQAKAFLTGQITNDIEALQAGTGCYAALLTNKAKMLGDLRVIDTGTELWLDTERAALQVLFDTIQSQFRAGPQRSLQRLPLHINDEAFAEALVAAWRAIAPPVAGSRRAG